jgi:hypothetical protein
MNHFDISNLVSLMASLSPNSTYKSIASRLPWCLKSRWGFCFIEWPCFRLRLSQTLYAGTVRFNILLGAVKPQSEVTQKEVEQACRDANILDFINSLPEFVSAFSSLPSHLLTCDFGQPSGFDTEVGSKGSQLSGGQKRMLTYMLLSC